MKDRPHITINIGPQDSESWFFVCIVLAMWVCGWYAIKMKEINANQPTHIESKP